jgi:anti-sigma factor RsiW
MKRVLATSILTFAIIAMGTNFADAQTKSSWIPTKAVQKIANKKLYTSDEVKASHIEAKSAAIPAQVVSKRVQRVTNRDVSPAEGNVVSKGYPTWTISKPVHRGKK